MRTFVSYLGIALLLCLVGCQNPPANQCTVSGCLEGVPENSVLILSPVSHDSELPIAEINVVDGKFEWTDTIAEPLAVYVRLKDYYGHAKCMMLEPGIIKLSGKVEFTKRGEDDRFDMSKVSVSGSPLTDKYLSLMSVRDSMDVIYNANHERFSEVNAAMVEARNKKDQALIKKIAESEEYKAFLEADHQFFLMVEKSYNKVIMDNKDTYWGPLMLISLTSYLSEDNKKTFEAFGEEAKNSIYGKMVREELYPAGKVGSQVPAFMVKGQDGKEVAFADLCKDKKFVLIDFWASWCQPCRKEIPNLKNLYAKYASKGFEIVSISIDKKKADWEKALKEEGLQWPNYLDTEGIAGLYKVKFVPTMYLVDGKGIMVGENLRGEALAQKLSELFGE